MPADSASLEEEGVVIAPQPVRRGALEGLVQRMRQPRGAHGRPARAARREPRRGEPAGGARTALWRGAAAQATDAVLDYAERRTRACLQELRGEAHAQDVLEAREGDLTLRLRAKLERRGAGARLLRQRASAPGEPQLPAFCHTLGVLLRGARADRPRHPALLRRLPADRGARPWGCLLNARRGAAVAAGNVETSSRVADLVMAAFGRALGQGTMNNLTLGDERFSYYETTGGGQGACADADGPSAVHVAMSNTLNTPIEALERDFPLRVRRYAVRRDSGGAGAHGGGDGVVRELEALTPMAYSLITERRRHAPPGASGGGEGARGRNLLIDERGEACELPPKSTGTLSAGERLRIETPGGGGHGAPARDAHVTDVLADQPKVVAS